jgi:hypothetical protein
MYRRTTSGRLVCLGLLLGCSFIAVQPAYSQGCIVARSSEQVMGPEGSEGYMGAGEWQFTMGYRHQYSFRHFVGPTEQKQRIQLGNQVMNKINLLDYSLSYTISKRWSASADIPLLLASRRSNNSPFTTTAQGIGDAVVTAQAWIFDPGKSRRGNIQLGGGLMIPTGKDNLTNSVDRFDGKGAQSTLLDYSIQPGGGGWGAVLRWQSFLSLGRDSLVYFNGSYTATPQNTNNVLRSTNLSSPTAYVSISDQYLLEAGVMRSIKRVPGLALSLGPRMEGVPAHDLFGENLGFRRPGFAISLQPGIVYSRNRSILSISVGKAIYRDRVRSVPDIMTGGHGDAAFADYVWLANYTVRFGTPKMAHVAKSNNN